MTRHLQTLPPLTRLPPNLLDARRQHRLTYAPLLIQYTPARLIALIHLRLFRPPDWFGVGRVGRNRRGRVVHSSTRPVRGEILLRGHRAPVPAMHVQTSLGVRIDGRVPLLSAEGAGFVRPMAHRA